MPLCTTCAAAVPYLYTVYHTVNNARLERCPSCGATADPYVEHDSLVIALDLILLKLGVYRHLLFNRGTPPRKVEQAARGHDGPKNQSTEEKSVQDASREQARRMLVLRVGTGVVLVDAFVRWSRIRGSGSPIAPLSGLSTSDQTATFLRILLASFVETVSFHIGVASASTAVLILLNRLARWNQHLFPASSIRQQLRYSHISLCLLYSSLTKFMLLLILSIWGTQPRQDAPSPAYVYKVPFESPLWHVMDDSVLDRTWVVRNMLGGMSAGFGLRVVLDCHPFFTALVVFSGWGIKTAIANIVREFIGPGDGVEETWLAYSIP
ncbi:Arv1-like family-domain-containing protein [Gloeopeniophorella convolvens]|nr:Arv1-like family-domain-containing protein [Gloeopeniophorella convolvens]